MMTDRELISRRHELERRIEDGPVGQPETNIAALERAVDEARGTLDRLDTSGARAQLDWFTRERDDALETMARRERWIDDHADLLGEYTEVRQELDRRVAARTLLYKTNPPEDLLEQIGTRSDSLDPGSWDAAVAVYARTRLEAGPEIDLNDLATHLTGTGRVQRVV